MAKGSWLRKSLSQAWRVVSGDAAERPFVSAPLRVGATSDGVNIEDVYPLTPLHVPDALDILDRTDVAHDGEERWLHERAAVRTALLNHVDLGQKGVLIVADGKPAAFSIFEAAGPDMAVVHFEKADRHYKGLYQIVNQETAKAIVAEGRSYINREEDMGIDGLRQAKHSYGPIEVVPSYTLTTI